MSHKPTFRSLAEHTRSWVSPRELARYQECHERSIRRMISAGAIKADKVGRHYRIPITEAKRAFSASCSA